MNPIARMMKRYIKMPLKKALPLLFISALVLVSISGCTSSTNPTATPTATNGSQGYYVGLTPLLQKLEPALKQQYGSGVSEGAKHDGVYVFWVTSKGWNASAGATEWKTADAAYLSTKSTKPDANEVSSPNSITGFGLAAATAALGHKPNQTFDVYLKGTGDWTGSDEEWISYDQIVYHVTYMAPS